MRSAGSTSSTTASRAPPSRSRGPSGRPAPAVRPHPARPRPVAPAAVRAPGTRARTADDVADNASSVWSIEAKLDRGGFELVPGGAGPGPAARRPARAGVVPSACSRCSKCRRRRPGRPSPVRWRLTPCPSSRARRSAVCPLDAPRPVDVRGIRCELTVNVEVTDPKGLSDELVVVRAELATPTTLHGAIEFGIEGVARHGRSAHGRAPALPRLRQVRADPRSGVRAGSTTGARGRDRGDRRTVTADPRRSRGSTAHRR